MEDKGKKRNEYIPYDISIANSINMNSDAVSPTMGAQMAYAANHMEDMEPDNSKSNEFKKRLDKNHKDSK